MVAIIFADLSVTLRIKRAQVAEDKTVRAVLDELADGWELSEITVRSHPISDADLDRVVGGLAKRSWVTGDLVLEIEKH